VNRLQQTTATGPSSARDRILEAAYGLFSARGIGTVGVDSIVAESGVAKMSLYRHYGSKEGLVLAFLEQREKRWTVDWLEAEVARRADDPAQRLLAIFDVFDGWFRRSDFEGCSFINVLLEGGVQGPVHEAAVGYLSNIRRMISRFATEAGLADVAAFAQTWHMLMKGSIVAAHEGNREAARQARHGAAMILDAWPRTAGTTSGANVSPSP
jgi:AcrR family transcriptional regulator